jgi:hypothetical protein
MKIQEYNTDIQPSMEDLTMTIQEDISSTLQQGEMVRVDLERTIDLPISEL